MNRKVILITNPGEKGEEDFCEGVYADAINYANFLQSPIGGFWNPDEITHLHQPSQGVVAGVVALSKSCDYLKIIFCGHGFIDARSQSTILVLSKDNYINENHLRNEGQAQAIILDCCRVVLPLSENEKTAAQLIKESNAPIMDGLECRARYNAHIRSCGPDFLKIHSCNVNEKAGDDSEKGGLYSSNLIRNAIQWSRAPRQSSAILELPDAHAAAKAATHLEKPEQNAIIKISDRGPYFPFAVFVPSRWRV